MPIHHRALILVACMLLPACFTEVERDITANQDTSVDSTQGEDTSSPDTTTAQDTSPEQDTAPGPCRACTIEESCCDGACVDLQYDPMSCGACGNTCIGACTDGTCVEAVEVTVGQAHACARLNTGAVYCWGSNARGQLGNGAIDQGTHVPSPVMDLDDATQISAGFDHTCALRSNNQVVCWGYNFTGELGNGTVSPSGSPVTVMREDLTPLDNVLGIGSGAGHTCAYAELLSTPGEIRLWCWGRNVEGQLGLGRDSQVETRAVQIGASFLDSIDLVVGGDFHTCARRSDKQLYCWGINENGQLGTGGIEAHNVPFSIPDVGAVEHLALGFGHTCAGLTDGTLKCWGRDDFNQLGRDVSGFDAFVPGAVSGVSGSQSVAAGQEFTCLATAARELYCWGQGTLGQLGHGDRSGQPSPLKVDLSSLEGLPTQLSATYQHVCAVLDTGQVACWGNNERGQAGWDPADNSRCSGSAPCVFVPTVIPDFPPR